LNPELNHGYSPQEQRAREALRTVLDPELMVNIVDLGLIYGLDFSKEGRLGVQMTFSTPFCPLGESIVFGVNNVLNTAFPDRVIDVEIVWEPRWSHEMISEAGRKQLEGH
jgi:metal-sulfur cluster biosynthetic enzyme